MEVQRQERFRIHARLTLAFSSAVTTRLYKEDRPGNLAPMDPYAGSASLSEDDLVNISADVRSIWI